MSAERQNDIVIHTSIKIIRFEHYNHRYIGQLGSYWSFLIYTLVYVLYDNLLNDNTIIYDAYSIYHNRTLVHKTLGHQPPICIKSMKYKININVLVFFY